MSKQEINAARALELRQGPPKRTWPEVTRLLSVEDGRVPPYQVGSLQAAIRVFQGKGETSAQRYARQKKARTAIIDNTLKTV